MATDINTVTLSGRLTRDPELRSIPSGTSIASFGLAFSTSKKQGDEWIEEPNFVDLTAWGKRGEFYAERLSKGSLVFVSGKLRYSSWEAQDGSKRSKLEIVVDEIKSPDLFNGNGSGGARPARDTFVPATTSGVDDDIPF